MPQSERWNVQHPVAIACLALPNHAMPVGLLVLSAFEKSKAEIVFLGPRLKNVQNLARNIHFQFATSP